MTLRVATIACTTDAVGSASAATSAPVNGWVCAIRCASSWGGTSDLVFRAPAQEGSGTILSLTDQAGPFFAFTGGSIQAGGPSAFVGGVPVDGHLELTIAEGSPATSGTAHVFIDER